MVIVKRLIYKILYRIKLYKPKTPVGYFLLRGKRLKRKTDQSKFKWEGELLPQEVIRRYEQARLGDFLWSSRN